MAGGSAGTTGPGTARRRLRRRASGRSAPATDPRRRPVPDPVGGGDRAPVRRHSPDGRSARRRSDDPHADDTVRRKGRTGPSRPEANRIPAPPGRDPTPVHRTDTRRVDPDGVADGRRRRGPRRAQLSSSGRRTALVEAVAERRPLGGRGHPGAGRAGRRGAAPAAGTRPRRTGPAARSSASSSSSRARRPPTLDLVDLDLDALLAELARRADQVIGAERFLLMVRVGPGPAASSSTTGASTPTRPGRWPPSSGTARDAEDGPGDAWWSTSPRPARRYGRLAVFVDPGGRARGVPTSACCGCSPSYAGQRARRLHGADRRPPERHHGADHPLLQRAAVRAHQPGPGPPDPGRHRPRGDRVRPVDRLPVGQGALAAACSGPTPPG